MKHTLTLVLIVFGSIGAFAEKVSLDESRIIYCIPDGKVSGGQFWYLEPDKKRIMNAFHLWEIERYLFQDDINQRYFTVTLFNEDYRQNRDTVSVYQYLIPEEEIETKRKGYRHAQGWMSINYRSLKYHFKQYWSRGTSKEEIYNTYGTCSKYNEGLNLD